MFNEPYKRHKITNPQTANHQMDSKVTVNLLLFGATKDLVNTGNGSHELRVSLNNHWINDKQLLDYICVDLLPTLSEIKPSLALAVNEEYICNRNDILLRNDDTIAVIPPITGG
ncbi:molybdopterin synthase sulfur carrier subunit-like protein [Leptotrombidium deliense]|uniref:Molybdopterin synthase sulfur carrier subunit-like protein n=1 Tax=Leptotrombidium deliense TaxID=299467 RepID=A0A443SH84_9ACAR|nr:molybdopterin synthase sulfur carrier subunit-like protein [Leptotrombidium deliense]